MATQKKIDINKASLEDLASLVGIGQAKAETIIQQRNAKGGFSSIADLKKIPGIGPSILDKNKGNLHCSTIRHSGKRAARVSDRETRSSIKQEKASERPSTSNTPRTRCLRSDSSSCDWPVIASRTRSHSTSDVHLDHEACSVKAEVSCPRDVLPKAKEQELMQDEEEDEEIIFTQRLGVRGPADGEESVQTHSEQEEDEGSLKDEKNNSSTQEEASVLARIPAPMLPTHNLWMRRKRGFDNDTTTEKLAVSPDKKACRDGEPSLSHRGSSHSNSFQFGTIKTGACMGATSIRKKIPSRSNPPPELENWLQTFHTWSHPERLLALDELMTMCEPTEVRHVMSVIEPQFQRDFISLLPKELALYVLSFLEPKDLLKAAQTCRYWRILAEDNLLWKEKCQEENIDEQLVYESRLRRRSSQCGSPPWKHIYMRQYEIEQNWRSGPIKPSKVLKGHDDHVITCLEFCGSRIVSGSDDNTLKVWSAVTGKCLRTLVGHTGGVWSSQMAGNVIISGSTDRTLKVWNADTGVATHTLYGHTSTVRCMHLHGNKVVSGSRDATLRVWDIESGECLHVLMGHVAAVRCVQYDGRKVVSGAYDYMVKVWDPETETCIHTLQGHINRVYSLQFDGVHIVSGSLDTLIRVWDVETGNCIHTLRGHQSLTSGMELKDNILVSGNADSTVKVWDIISGQCLQTLQGPNKHQSAVTCLQFNKKFVITSSDDGTVKIWDLKSGDFLRNLVALDSGGSGGVVWRVRCSNTKLVCAVGSRNGTEETKLLVLDFDVEEGKKALV